MPKVIKKTAVVKQSIEKPKTVLVIESIPAPKDPTPVAKHTKLAILIALLNRPEGSTMDDLVEATGWQRHSVHGTLSGVLRKRLGLPVITEFGERGRMYRIADAR